MTLRESIEERLQRLKELEKNRRRHRVEVRREFQIRSFDMREFRAFDPEDVPEDDTLGGWDTEDMDEDERFNLIKGMIRDLLQENESMRKELDGAENAIKILCRIIDDRAQGLQISEKDRHALILIKSCGLIAAGVDVEVSACAQGLTATETQ